MYHPDKISENDVSERAVAQAILARVNLAKEVLLDDEKRKIYDKLGEDGLKQLSKDSDAAETLISKLEEAYLEREIRRLSEVAKPEGEFRVHLDVQDMYQYVTTTNRSGNMKLHPPEINWVAASKKFSHSINENSKLIFEGQVTSVLNEPPYVQFSNGFGHYQTPGTKFGVHLQKKPNSASMWSVGGSTDGRELTTSAQGYVPVSKGTTTGPLAKVMLSAYASHTTRDLSVFGGSTSLRVGLQKPLYSSKDGQRNIFANTHLQFTSAGLEGVRVGLDAENRLKTGIQAELLFGANTLGPKISLGQRLPHISLRWRRYEAASVFFNAGVTSGVEVGYDVVRHLDKHTTLSMGSSIGSYGLNWKVEYKRAKQSISIPIHVTDEIPSAGWLLALFAVPLALDLFTQHILLRPYYKSVRAAQQNQILESIAKAMREQQFMRREAEDRRRRERDNKGIVILQARYGLQDETGDLLGQPQEDGELPSWIPVHIVLQTRVHHEGEYSRLVIVGNLARIPGFTDLAPGRSKVLDIYYLYNNMLHHIIVEDEEKIVLPQMDHRLPQGTTWKDMKFDWPLDADVTGTAEGSSSYNGVD